jgi:5'-deoxynucleotidase YfbR-like HD superfamily hydrolase
MYFSIPYAAPTRLIECLRNDAVMNKFLEVADFVQCYLAETGKKESQNPTGPEYRWEHTLRVAQWAKRLAVEEAADVNTCVVAALLHDVSHFVSEDYSRHGVKSGEIAKDFLSKKGHSESFIENVVYAVKCHVAELNPKTLEAKILQDSDTLDRFGYVRILLFGKTSELANLETLKQKALSSLAYLDKLEKGDFGPMWTKTGREKLRMLLDLNRSIQKGLLEELESTRIPDVEV